jgi:hypothetical protein
MCSCASPDKFIFSAMSVVSDTMHAFTNLASTSRESRGLQGIRKRLSKAPSLGSDSSLLPLLSFTGLLRIPGPLGLLFRPSCRLLLGCADPSLQLVDQPFRRVNCFLFSVLFPTRESPVVNRGPQRVPRLRVVDCEDKLRVNDLRTVNLCRAVVRVVRAPDASSAVLNAVGKFNDQICLVRRADDLVLAPRFHFRIEGIVGKVTAAAIGKKYLFRVNNDGRERSDKNIFPAFSRYRVKRHEQKQQSRSIPNTATSPETVLLLTLVFFLRLRPARLNRISGDFSTPFRRELLCASLAALSRELSGIRIFVLGQRWPPFPVVSLARRVLAGKKVILDNILASK